MASLSPPHTLVRRSIPLFLLLFTACQAVPINQPFSTDRNPSIDESDHALPIIKPPTETFSHETRSSIPLSARPPLREPASVKPHDVHVDSVTNPVRPFARALQSESANQPQLGPKGKLSIVDYLSPPLRGTETRDRYALHISSLAEKETPNIQKSTADHQEQRQGLVSNFNELNESHQYSGKNATYPDSLSPFQSSVRSREDQDLPQHQNTENLSPRTRTNGMGDDTTDMSTAGKYHNTLFHKHHEQSPSSATASPLEEEPRTSRENENKSKRAIEIAKDVLRRSTHLGRILYEKVKSAMEECVSGSKSSDLPVVQEKRADGYSEEDVINLVNDIIREIQMRSNDMGDHAKMLEKTDRWDPNDIKTRERKLGMGSSPLLYMRTKVLVTPKTLVDAVMTSTEKLFSSKADPLPRKDMSKLLKEVQIRLAPALTPAK